MDQVSQIMNELNKILGSSSIGFGALAPLQELTKALPGAGSALKDIGLPTQFGSGTTLLALFFLLPIFRMFLSPTLFFASTFLNSICLIGATLIQLVTSVVVCILQLLRSLVHQTTGVLHSPLLSLALVPVGLVLFFGNRISLSQTTGWSAAIATALGTRLLSAAIRSRKLPLRQQPAPQFSFHPQTR